MHNAWKIAASRKGGTFMAFCQGRATGILGQFHVSGWKIGWDVSSCLVWLLLHHISSSKSKMAENPVWWKLTMGCIWILLEPRNPMVPHGVSLLIWFKCSLHKCISNFDPLVALEHSWCKHETVERISGLSPVSVPNFNIFLLYGSMGCRRHPRQKTLMNNNKK